MTSETDEKTRKPEDTPFKQQKLKAWQPILTPNWVIGTFAVVGLIFIPIGVILHFESEGVVEYSIQYDGNGMKDANSSNIENLGSGCYLDEEDDGDTFNVTKRGCLVNFKIDKDMVAPVYVYYQLDNFYQNHRRYVQSRSDSQLRGKYVEDPTNCDPMKETPDKVYKYNSTGDRIDDDKKSYRLNPCGLIANSLFNDIFWVNSLTLPNGNIYYQENEYDGDDLVNVMDQTGIAWKTDVDTKFKNLPEDERNEEEELYLWENEKYRYIVPKYEGQEPIANVTAWTKPAPSFGVQNEHFIVWMRTAGLPSFRKLYGRIDQDLDAGTELQFLVSSNFVVSTFEGKKSLVISTTSWFGGRNPFLGIAYIVVGALCMVLAILFFAKHKLSPRKLGDTSYLVWKNNH